MRTQKERLNRTSFIASVVAILGIFVAIGFFGGYENGTITLGKALICALPCVVISIGAMKLHIAAENRLRRM